MAGTRFQITWSSMLSIVQPYKVVDVTYLSQIKTNKDTNDPPTTIKSLPPTPPFPKKPDQTLLDI